MSASLRLEAGVSKPTGCLVVVGGDLNVHVDPSEASAACLSDLFHTVDMKQHVTQPTHQAGGTLDLIITFCDFRRRPQRGSTGHCV